MASLVAFPSCLKSVHWLLNYNQKIKMVQDLQDRHLAHNIIMRWSVFSSSVTACQHHVPSMWERHITSQVFFLLLLLSHFSRVRLCATAQTAAHQAPPSLGFSRQEHWSGLPFPSPMHESESEVAQSCLTLSDLMDCSLPGFSVHGIFQARVLEWGAIAFSGYSS